MQGNGGPLINQRALSKREKGYLWRENSQKGRKLIMRDKGGKGRYKVKSKQLTNL
jgi:hypothetical protein